MRPGTWPDTAVRTIAVRAIVNGVQADVDAVSLTSEMTPDLPVVGGGPVAVTDGSVDWPQRLAVTTHAPQPFLPSTLPAVGTPLAIDVGDGAGQWFRQIVGRTDSNAGAFTSGTVTSKIIDNIDRLNIPVTHDPLLSTHPPVDGGLIYRRTALINTYVADLCARRAGFYATAPQTPSTRLSAPLMGSTWPEVGTLVDSFRNGDGSSAPSWVAEPSWGWSVNLPLIRWDLSSPATAPVITVNLATPDHSDDVACWVKLLWGGPTSGNPSLRLYHDQVTDVVRVDIPTPGETTVTAGSLPRLAARRAAVGLIRTGATWTATLALSDGRSAVYPGIVLPTSWRADMAEMGGSGRMGGLLVEQTANPFASLNAPQTARFRMTAPSWLTAMPTLRADKSALTLLTELAKAECASVWINADGVLQWAARGVLEAAASVATKTTELSLDDLTWSSDYSSVYQQVTMTRREPTVSKSTEYRVTLGQGSTQNLKEDQTNEEWIQPSSDEDWVMVDQIGTRLNTTSLTTEDEYGDAGAKKLRTNTWFGGIIMNDADDAVPAWSVAAEVSISVEWVASDKGHYTTTATNPDSGDHPAGSYFINQIKDNQPLSLVPKYLAGTGLPLVRGKGLVQWASAADAVLPTGAVRGVANYTHDVDWRVQSSTPPSPPHPPLADALSAPRPEISVSIDPDPRLEMGDKITLEDPDRTGLTLDMVVTGIRQSYGSGAPTMTLAGRLTRVEQTWDLPDETNPWQLLLDYWKSH